MTHESAPFCNALHALGAALRTQADALEALASFTATPTASALPRYLNARQAEAEGLIRRRAFLAAAKRGDLPSFRHGREVRVKAPDLLVFLEGKARSVELDRRPAAPQGFDPIANALAKGRLRALKGGRGP
jgi:hypothetical protein